MARLWPPDPYKRRSKSYSYEAFNRPSILNSSLHNFRFQSSIFLTAVRSSQTKLHKKRPDTGYLDLDAA